MNPAKSLYACALALAACLPLGVAGFEIPSAGPLCDEFPLTLAPGHRCEILGPAYYAEQRETQETWAFPPLLSYTRDPGVELTEFDLLYPVLTYNRYGDQYRWQLCQLLSFAGGPTQREDRRRRFTVFPFYFQQRSSLPEENYTAVVPFYGHLKHRLFRDESSFVMFPLYAQSRKRDVVTDNYLYPIFHRRRGDGLAGWQFWPLVGHEQKTVTTRTNRFNDVESVPGHDRFFALWPFFFNSHTGLGSTNPVWEQASLPLYSFTRSPERDSTTVLWPFFSRIDDRARKYREWDVPWPLMVFARGEGKTTTRVWPFYSHAQNATRQSTFYLWPIYRHTHAKLPPLDCDRKRIVFYLYSDNREKNTETGAHRRQTDCWPLFSRKLDYTGNDRLQILALLEPFTAGSHKISRNWSPLWSLWRSEKNPRTSTTSQSLLWNLYRRDTAPARQKVSVCFGLFQTESDANGKRTRLFFLPIKKSATESARTS